MTINSREKGKKGEREAAAKVREVFGVEAHRGQQHRGGPDSPDIITDIDGVHHEVKRVKKRLVTLFDYLERADEEHGNDEVPLLMYRPDCGDWVAIAWYEDLPDIVVALAQTPNVWPRIKNIFFRAEIERARAFWKETGVIPIQVESAMDRMTQELCDTINDASSDDLEFRDAALQLAHLVSEANRKAAADA